MSEAKNLDRIWVWYLLTVTAAVMVAGGTGVDGDGAGFVGVHCGLLVAVLLTGRWTQGLAAAWQRVIRAVFTCVGLPIVFSSLGLVLPAVHPEPFEWTWIAWDRALVGGDPTRMAQTLGVPWFVEVLHLCYASFYFLPIITLVAVGRGCGWVCFDRALLLVTFCFLLSYAAYLVWPTLPPYRFLPHEHELHGLWLSDALHRTIDVAELHRWDCFPSGHTMLSLVCVVLAWRWSRRLLWLLIPVVAMLVLSTVALRYHYLVDVLAGASLVMPSIWLIDCLAPVSDGPAPSDRG